MLVRILPPGSPPGTRPGRMIFLMSILSILLDVSQNTPPWLPSWQPPWPHPTTVPTSAHAGASPPIETSQREDHHLISTITDRRAEDLGDKMKRRSCDIFAGYGEGIYSQYLSVNFNLACGIQHICIYTHFFLLIKEGQCCIIGGRTESQR